MHASIGKRERPDRFPSRRVRFVGAGTSLALLAAPSEPLRECRRPLSSRPIRHRVLSLARGARFGPPATLLQRPLEVMIVQGRRQRDSLRIRAES